MGFTAQPTFRAHTPGPPLHYLIPPSHAPPATPPNPDPPPPPPPPRRRCRGGHLPSGPPPDGSPLPAVRLPPRPPSPGPQARRGYLRRATRLLGAALGRQGAQGRACPSNRLREGERPGGRQQAPRLRAVQADPQARRPPREVLLPLQTVSAPGLLGARRAGGPRRERSRPAAQGGCSVCLVTANVRCVVSTFVAEAITVRRGLL
jgi:hypothetical protein